MPVPNLHNNNINYDDTTNLYINVNVKGKHNDILTCDNNLT